MWCVTQKQKTVLYKYTSLNHPFSLRFSDCNDRDSQSQEYLQCLAILQAYRQGVLLQENIYIFILVAWITAWTGNDETDVRE